MRADTERKVRKFIEDNFLFREDRAGISDTESLVDAGLIDSTGVLELVAFLEGELGLRMADAEIVPENLDSIRAIVGFVEGKRASVVGGWVLTMASPPSAGESHVDENCVFRGTNRRNVPHSILFRSGFDSVPCARVGPHAIALPASGGGRIERVR